MTGSDDIELTLRWRHGRGGYGAYFEALSRGLALASSDAVTGRVSFPPRAADAARTVTLPGTGTIVAITRGPAALPLREQVVHASFALVAVDGADNLTFARVLEDGGPMVAGDRVRLLALTEAVPHPAQAAVFVREGPPDGS